MEPAVNDNLLIWDQVKETPSKYVKLVEYGNNKYHSVKSYHLFRRATEMFGPYGTGWGSTILREWYEDGAPLFDSKHEKLLCMERHHHVKIRFWYRSPVTGKREFVPTAYGTTPYVFRTGKGIVSDGEVFKKSLTDALKKALSMLGFAADIFMQEYDDPSYKAAAEAKQQIAQSDDKNQALSTALDALDKKTADVCRSLQTLSGKSSINRIARMHESHLSQQAKALDTDLTRHFNTLHKAQQQALDAIVPLQDVACDVCGTVLKDKPGADCTVNGCTGTYTAINAE